jgi:predicted metal-dependent phosphoesterase TrpH
LIDLHTHTTASDGLCAPAELVSRAAAAGVTVLAVTDHDTVAGVEPARAACVEGGTTLVPGIEITALVDDLDVHILGYFIDISAAALSSLLRDQRKSRFQRITAVVERLAEHGIRLDAAAILRPAVEDPGKSPGRPWIARALVAAGHVRSSEEAFDRWLGEGCPAFVPRAGLGPAAVIDCIHRAGGIASLAHPGLLGHDEWIPGLVADGLDAVEAYHSEHDAEATARYLNVAAMFGLAVSGGSDYHGDRVHGVVAPGSVSLPPDQYERLRLRKRTGVA